MKCYYGTISSTAPTLSNSRSLSDLDRSLRQVTSRNIALPKQPHLVLRKSPHHTVYDAPIMEEHQVTLLPIMRIHPIWRDRGPLQPVNNGSHLLQILHDRAIRQMQLSHRRGVHLQRQPAGHGVPPAHRQDLDLALVDGREVVERNLLALADEAQPVGARAGTAHPDVRVGGVLDAGGAGKVLVLGAEAVEHVVAAYKGGSAQGHVQLVACAVVVAAGLAAAAGDLDGEQGGDDGGRKIIERGVDVPAVEAREVVVLFGRDLGGVEGAVVGVAELEIGEAFVGGDEAVTDDLDLGLVGDGL